MEVVTETNETGCHLVVSHKPHKDGHIYISIDRKKYRLHRIVYEKFYGEISEGLVVRHKCDNPNCINPEHLELGTHKDNVKDRVDRNRSAKGESNGRTKLTEEQALFIKYDKSHNVSELARMFSVSRKAIRLIKQGINWPDL